MSKRFFKCKNDHVIQIDIPEKKFDKFLEQCKALKKVCPQCKPENIEIELLREPEKHQGDKWYSCRHGHRTKAYAFANGMCGIEWGDDWEDHENFKATPEEAMEKIANGEIKCRVVIVSEKTGKPRVCNCNLKEEDATEVVRVPSTLNFKTKVRVGDVWKKYNVPEPKMPEIGDEYIQTGKISETEFSKRQSARLKKLRKERQTEKAGEVIDKPTKKRYHKRNPGRPKSEDL